jgi:hypothetical protein
MQFIPQSAHDRMVREAADRYIREGYPVQIMPLDADLPDFLKGYRPDLIVTTPEGCIVVNVKTRGVTRTPEEQERLKKVIEGRPGWRYQYYLDNRREEELVTAEQPVLTPEEIEARLQASRQLADSGLLDSALVVAWSSIEAVLREASRVEGLSLPNQGAGPLVTALYAEGDLERDDYLALMQILKVRHQAAHGFRTEAIDRSLLERAQEIARRLMSQQRKAA